MYEGGGLFPLLEHFCVGKDLVQLAHKGDNIAVIQRPVIYGNGDGQDPAHCTGVVALGVCHHSGALLNGIDGKGRGLGRNDLQQGAVALVLSVNGA